MYMTKIDPTTNMQRFYEIAIEPTLFCSVTVVRRYGRIGERMVTLSPVECEDFDQAQRVALRLVKKRLKRGYHESERKECLS